MYRKLLALAIILSTCSVGTQVSEAYTQYSQQQTATYQAPLTGRVVTVPVGVSIPALTSTELSSEFLTVGSGVNLRLGSDFYYSGVQIAPSGSLVTGNVIQAKKASFSGRNGQLMIRFTSIITPNGQRIPISGKIRTEDNTGLLTGGTKMTTAKNYAKNTVIGAGAGALAGVIISPLAGGEIGRGTALATAVGGGAGLAKSLVDKGKNVVIPANSYVDIEIDQPLTVIPNVYGY